LAQLTHAHPKIAAYPFTMLSPNIGILTLKDYRRVRVADVPGLIEGAHAGKGLGHEFLRHIERCGLLVVLLDLAGTDGRDPREDYRQLLAELELHDARLLEKPRLIVANKLDVPAAKKNLTAFKRRHKGLKVIEVSALTGDGVAKLRLAIGRALR
jgi:GTP-binding protein